MKNKIKFILAVFVTILVLSSCEHKVKTVVQKDLPIEVVKLKDAKAYDTLLVISTEETNYLFKKGEYMGAYDNTYEDGAGFIGCLLLFVFLLIILAIAL